MKAWNPVNSHSMIPRCPRCLGRVGEKATRCPYCQWGFSNVETLRSNPGPDAARPPAPPPAPFLRASGTGPFGEPPENPRPNLFNLGFVMPYRPSSQPKPQPASWLKGGPDESAGGWAFLRWLKAREATSCWILAGAIALALACLINGKPASSFLPDISNQGKLEPTKILARAGIGAEGPEAR